MSAAADVRLERTGALVLDPAAARRLHDHGWFGSQRPPVGEAAAGAAAQRRRKRQRSWDAWELSLEETMYQHGRGAVRVWGGDTGGLLDGPALWRACCAAQERLPATYATYAYWRRLGWVPRPGLQYGVTFLLYRDGSDRVSAEDREAQHQHAEYCVTVVDGTASDPVLPCWQSLQATQRVSAGVAKALLLCVVSPAAGAAAGAATAVGDDPAAGSGLQVQVIEVSRWAPELSRKG